MAFSLAWSGKNHGILRYPPLRGGIYARVWCFPQSTTGGVISVAGV
jgi:hypothetical protein